MYEPEATISAIEHFLTGSRHGSQTRRALRTVLFTDIVASTERAAAVGDDRWHSILDRCDELTRGAVDRFGGTVVKGTGDGHLVTMDGPAAAIRCAEAIRDAMVQLDLELPLRHPHR